MPATTLTQDIQRAESDPVGPRDAGQQPGGQVSGGGTEDGTAPLDFDDDEIYSGRGKNVRQGGTAHAEGADGAPLGPPAEQLSESNAPVEIQPQRGGR